MEENNKGLQDILLDKNEDDKSSKIRKNFNQCCWTGNTVCNSSYSHEIVKWWQS
ncbi:hypothetical protein IXZ16_05800 [Campylobacter fetus subsp. fetus]|nr:hypothetical protein IXZ25_06160 [Campylobacter fetus subsp. fetus]WKW18414.1 hypothetical protein IXZ16_05800 [Campylobacter fetus subsp. fetus]